MAPDKMENLNFQLYHQGIASAELKANAVIRLSSPKLTYKNSNRLSSCYGDRLLPGSWCLPPPTHWHQTIRIVIWLLGICWWAARLNRVCWRRATTQTRWAGWTPLSEDIRNRQAGLPFAVKVEEMFVLRFKCMSVEITRSKNIVAKSAR